MTSMLVVRIKDKKTTVLVVTMARIILTMNIQQILNMVIEKLIFAEGYVAIVKA
jgi:hypothetical protein